MKLPVEWIIEAVPIEASAEEIADRLTMAGLEVEEKAESEIGAVLDIKVTPNRGDCLSVLGVARELSAAYNVPLKVQNTLPPHNEQSPSPTASDLTSVSIEAPELCSRYTARVVRNLKVGPSPEWMRQRLAAAGMRAINNIVDVTNYVMLETGQPLHAFDYDTLAGHRIVIREALPGEILTTLDGTEHQLSPGMLLICDADRPVALAGIMGGAETEMTEQTTTLLLEAAHFNWLSVRRTARLLKMNTEASYRFSRTVDPMAVAEAANRACQLIAEIGAGEVVPGIVDVWPTPEPPRVQSLRPARVSTLLGFDVSADQVLETLARLGFQQTEEAAERPTPDAQRLSFVLPSWRTDLTREIDLVEEVGRVLGYEHIPEQLPTGASTQGGDSKWGQFAERIRELLSGAGLQEIVTHSLMPPSSFEEAIGEGGEGTGQRVAIRSALSAELSGLRQSVLPGLLDALARNIRRGQSSVALYEIGHVFHGGDGVYEETTSIGGLLAGSLGRSSWQRDARPGSADFYTARGLVELLAEKLRVAGLEFTPGQQEALHPGRRATVLLAGQPIGWIGEIHPRFTADLQTKERVYAFELSFEALQGAAVAARYTSLSSQPSAVRDIAPRLTADVPYSQIETAIRKIAPPFLESYRLTDVYTGAPLPEGTKSLTLSFTFRAADRTLTEAEVNDALTQIRTTLGSDCGAVFVG